MKKWLFCILLFFSCLSFNTQKAEAASMLEIAQYVVEFVVGDGLLEVCAKSIGCDEYEDTSLTDEIGGLFSSNKQVKVCAVNSILKNVARIVGAVGVAFFVAFVSAYLPGVGTVIAGILAVAAANLIANAISCLQMWLQSLSAQTTATSYKLCFDSSDDGHPLALTDKQIAKVLYATNKWPTVENIVAQYKKLCVQSASGGLETAKFYADNEYDDNILVHHADGYAYVYCASVFSACPCIFNVQRGKLKDPEYSKDENGVINMRDDGSLIFEGDSLDSRTNEKDYKDHYAKHCRLIRYKEIYQQAEDLASIFDESCFDLHGYSKRTANITAGLVQCFENTARNIFEKPIMSIESTNNSTDNAYQEYTNDLTTLREYYSNIQNVLGTRDTYAKAVKTIQPLTEDERNQILLYFQKLWFGKENTTKVEYSCENGRSTNVSELTTFYEKYVVAPSQNVTKYCCSSDTSINNSKTCFKDTYQQNNEEDTIEPKINELTKSLSVEDIFIEIEKIENLQRHIKNLQLKASKATETIMNNEDKSFGLTLFDILRNKLKVIATIALVLWIFLLGWKMINGDFGKIEMKTFVEIALKVFLCYMIVFSEEAKSYVFNLAIQTSQGVGMAINQVMESFRAQDGNRYNKVCQFTGTYTEKATKKYGAVKIAGETDANEIYTENKYKCQSWEKLVKSDNHYYCEEYNVLCPTDAPVLECTNYFKDYDDKNNTSFCKIGSCHDSQGNVKTINAYSTGKFRDADMYQETKLNACSRALKDDDNLYEGVESTGCTKYETKYGETFCVQYQCKNFDYTCPNTLGTDSNSDAMEKSCTRYEINADGSYGQCLNSICSSTKSVFLPMPPLERPYKRVGYTGKDEKTGLSTTKYYTPQCHKYAVRDEYIDYDSVEKNPSADLKYSKAANDYIYVCPEGYVMDEGFRISEYIKHGIIENSDNAILTFQSLLSDSEQQMDKPYRVAKLMNRPVKTAVAVSDSNGYIEEIDFIDSNMGSEGTQRAKYRTYIRSLLTSLNKGADYPNIKKYKVSRNYKHISFWDSMDCKIIQFISMQGFDGGFTEDIEGVISGVQQGNLNNTVSSAVNGMFQFLKFIFMCFPFGILVFMLMFMLGAMLFMLVARAAQQYCVCVFQLVLVIYLSPFVFVMYLFEQTKDAYKEWFKELKANIFGACVPFVSISMFLFIIDWVLFGDSSLYVEKGLFTTTGEISLSCYEGDLSSAPIACLSKRLLKQFSLWDNFLSLFTGNWGGLFKADSWKMMGYFVIRALFGAALIMSMTSILDKMEKELYKILGDPKADIGAGFNQSAGESIKTGAGAALSAGKFALGSLSIAASVVGTALLLTGIGRVLKKVKASLAFAGKAVSFAFKKAGKAIKNFFTKPFKNAAKRVKNWFNGIVNGGSGSVEGGVDTATGVKRNSGVQLSQQDRDSLLSLGFNQHMGKTSEAEDHELNKLKMKVLAHKKTRDTNLKYDPMLKAMDMNIQNARNSEELNDLLSKKTAMENQLNQELLSIKQGYEQEIAAMDAAKQQHDQVEADRFRIDDDDDE